MNIVMVTNTFLPHVGGVARSVQRFTDAYRSRGHKVLTVAPEFRGMPDHEPDVVRVPAIQNFNGSDFSVALPVPSALTDALNRFGPDIVHSHHPFLLGDTALRIAAFRRRPLVFTHHTMYEQYTHYVPLEADGMKLFVIALSTGYANRCNRVIAPSESVKRVLEDRGVETPVEVVPTGVDIEEFGEGDGAEVRARLGIAPESFVVGHVGRLAPEKNLSFLSEAVAHFLVDHTEAHFLVVGTGPSQDDMREVFKRKGVDARAHFAGRLTGTDLVDALHAMDVFAFSSKSETQGMVLIEAMAAGVPVVAVDAPGVREVVVDGVNGRLLRREERDPFSDALYDVSALSEAERETMRQAARDTAREFSTEVCAEKAVRVYESLLEGADPAKDYDERGWEGLLRGMEQEWYLWVNRFVAARAMVSGEIPTRDASNAQPHRH